MPYKDKERQREYWRNYHKTPEQKERGKIYRLIHHQEILEYQRKRRKKHPEYSKQQYQKHRVKILSSNKIWREKHKEERKKYRHKYHQSHREEAREKITKYWAEHPQKRKDNFRRWRLEHLTERKAYRKKCYQENAESEKHKTWVYLLKRNFKLTPKDYDRMLLEQGGGCYICGGKNKNNHRLSVDHNHETNKVRRLLCSRCNLVLGAVNESETVLGQMLSYLHEFAGVV